MALTPSFFKSKRGRWRETGFMTRFLPVSFAYTDATAHAIHKSISQGTKLPEPKPLHVPEFPTVIRLPEKHGKTIIARAEELGGMMKTYGFRYQKSLRALAKAQAFLSGRGTVDSSDVGKILEWSQFFTHKEIEI